MAVLTKENIFRLNKSAWASLCFGWKKCQGCFDNINADQTRPVVGKALLWKLVKTSLSGRNLPKHSNLS